MREPRTTPTLPAPAARVAAPQTVPQAIPQVAQPVAAVPAPHAVPVVPTAVTPNGRSVEPAKVDKPSAPALRGPADSPVK